MPIFGNKSIKEIKEVLLPIHRDIDRYINELKEKKQRQENFKQKMNPKRFTRSMTNKMLMKENSA